MIVGAARGEVETAFEQFLRHRFGVFDNLFCVSDKLRRVGFRESYGNRGNRVHMRATLDSGEYGLIDLVGVLGFAQQHSASWASQCLVRRC